MRARIFKPARNAMQSGMARTHDWVLEFARSTPRSIDPLMGWTSSEDTQTQVQLRFATREEAEAYAAREGIAYTLVDPNPRKPNVRAQGYGENFAVTRKGGWTH